MSDRKVKILVQVGILLVVSGALFAFWLVKRGYTPPADVSGDIPITFVISEDGRTLTDEDNGFTASVPNQWVATQSVVDGMEIPNQIRLQHERADVVCKIDIAHGKNRTGTSATGFLSVFDIGNRGISNVRDSLFQLQDVGGWESAYLAWTEEDTNIRYREVYTPYQGYVMTLRYSEDISSERVSRQPVPCIRVFDDFVETGLQFP